MRGQKSGPQSDAGSGGQAGPEKRKRRNPEQIIANLREIDADLGAGLTIEERSRMMRPPRRLGAPDGAGGFLAGREGGGWARGLGARPGGRRMCPWVQSHPWQPSCAPVLGAKKGAESGRERRRTGRKPGATSILRLRSAARLFRAARRTGSRTPSLARTGSSAEWGAGRLRRPAPVTPDHQSMRAKRPGRVRRFSMSGQKSGQQRGVGSGGQAGRRR